MSKLRKKSLSEIRPINCSQKTHSRGQRICLLAAKRLFGATIRIRIRMLNDFEFAIIAIRNII
jgi:hypothetical protein